MERTTTRDTLQKIGEEVLLFGWVHTRRDHGKIVFIDLRDRWGLVQIVFIPNDEKLYKIAETLRGEWVIKVTGVVKERPEKMINPNLLTGKIEIEAKKLEVLSVAKTPPFALDTDGHEIGEEHRMRYRYLDLRRERLAQNLALRHGINQMIRQFLGRHGFIEVETPILTKSTPEGARDYVVPSRLHPGKFYALPQSPQQYKQLLMVAGIDRYFQIARCFRDEDTRGDRQPEFTQLDIEMSFVKQEEILGLIEELYLSIVRHAANHKHIRQVPFPRITYKEAMEKYGTDKPDLRENKSDKNELAFAFIVDFPMFEWREEENRWDAVHHPFTSPQFTHEPSAASYEEQRDAFIGRMKKDPGAILAWQYDLVCNDHELGGGSIRSHDPKILSAVFEVMGHKPEEIQAKFGHMLNAFEHGVPPHGGIATGLDRLLMILRGEPSIREVIAFPKTGDGRDLMMDGPSELEERQLKELHIKTER